MTSRQLTTKHPTNANRSYPNLSAARLRTLCVPDPNEPVARTVAYWGRLTRAEAGEHVKIRSTVLVVMGSLLLITACSRGEFAYVEQRDEGVFFKIPNDWSVFETREYKENGPSLDEFIENGVTPAPGSWQVVVDAGPEPTASNVQSFLNPFPVAVAEVAPLTEATRDIVSTAFLRSSYLGWDPVSPPEEFESLVLELDRDITEDGLRGNRHRFALDVAEGSTTVVDTIVLTDAENSKIYRFTIFCEEACFRANSNLIYEIIASFTVEAS